MAVNPLKALEYLHPRSLSRLSGQPAGLVEGRLRLKVLIGMGLGLLVGTLLGPTGLVTSKPAPLLATGWRCWAACFLPPSR